MSEISKARKNINALIGALH